MLKSTSWWTAVEPIDLRRGMDGLLTAIATQFGHDGLAGGAYVLTSFAVVKRFAIAAARESK